MGRRPKLNNEKQTGTIPINKDTLLEHGVLDKHKIAWLWHKAKRKVIVGGKGTGKTAPVKVKEICMLENNLDSNTFDFRKYKESATATMSGALLFMLRELKFKGFKVKEYKRSLNNLYKMDDKRIMDNNQKQRYGSLEDPTSTDGQAPSNGGFYSIVHIDEPVVKDDVLNPDKIPNKERFDTSMEIIRDNLGRFNEPYAMVREIETPQYEEFFTMNPWGNHPLIIEINEFLTEKEFLDHLFFDNSLYDLMGNLELIEELFSNQKWITHMEQNHTLMKYRRSDDTLFVRMTKWANPVNRLVHNSESLFKRLKTALINGEYRNIMLLLGIQYEEEIDQSILVFGGIDNYNMVEDNIYNTKTWELKSMTYSIDVDTSRVFTISPVCFFEKVTGITRDKNFITDKRIHTMPIIELKADGTGEFGQMNDVYVNLIEKIITKHYNENVKYSKRRVKSVLIAVDDKRKWYLNEIRKKKIPFITSYRSFQQHGDWTISVRQDMLITGIENGIITISSKNKNLVKDMKTCIKNDINKPERKTSGRTNYLDRIDSFENGIISYAHHIWKIQRRSNNG